MAGLVESFTRLFRRYEAPLAKTPQGYVKLTTKCMEQARKISSSTSLKFNHGLCKYLVEKLWKAVQSARLELRSGSLHSNSAEVFKFLFVLGMEVENFVQSCCQDSWIEAAVFLTNVSKHVSSIAFNLEIFAIVLLKSKAFDVAHVSETMVETVERVASNDAMELLIKVKSFIQSNKSSNKNKQQLAIFLLERLERSLERSSPEDASVSNSCERFFTSLEQMESLGKGATAIVHRAIWLGVTVAKKTFIGQNNSDFTKEVSILTGLFHPNIICLLGYGTLKHTCFIVMEVMDGDLFSLILKRVEANGYNGSPFTILEAVDIMHQVAEGVFYLHENRIVHRDLKSHNILIRCVKAASTETEYLQVKVADFGLSKIKERSSTFSNQTPNLGTARWMAPEMISFLDDGSRAETSDCEDSGLRYPFKADVYSFAMICYEILTGCQPFSSIASLKEVKKKVLDGGRPQLPDQCPLKLRDLIENCWSAEAKRRPSFDNICEELRNLKYFLMDSAISRGVREYSFEEVVTATENFKMMIMNGDWGNVYYGRLPDGKEVAVNALYMNSKKRLFEAIKEIDIPHKHLLSFLGFCTSEILILIHEIHKGSLRDHLNEDSSEVLDWKTRLNIGLQAALGLEYLHMGPHLVHGYVTSENILITSKYEAKVAGLGYSYLVEEVGFEEDSIQCIGTIGYIDPEYYINQHPNVKSDVYSFGVVLLELLTGRQSIDLTNPIPNICDWARENSMKGDIDAILDPAVKASFWNVEAARKVLETALRCVEPKRVHRPTMTEVVQELHDAVKLEGCSDSLRPSSSGASTVAD